jgi:threonine synthase
VTLAGLKKLVADGRVGREETVVLLLTGHTLKDPEYTIQFHRGELFQGVAGVDGPADPAVEAASAMLRREPLVLDPEVDAVLRALETAERQPEMRA